MKNFALLLAVAQAAAMALVPAPAAAQRAAAQGAAIFECGGVGQADAEAMKAKAGEHDLMLTFAESTGAYLADVDVEIRDGRGAVVLSARCEGPIMLVDLPRAGRWRIAASAGGATQAKTITTIRGKTARATLLWPAGAS